MFIGWCYALADVIAIYVVVDGKSQRQMLLPLFYQVADQGRAKGAGGAEKG